MAADRIPRAGFAATVRADLRGARHSASAWILSGLVPVLVVLGFAVAVVGDDTSAVSIIDALAEPLVVGLPLLGLLIGYNTILHERTSGTVVLSLSVPQSRLGMILAKTTARGSLIVVPLLVSLLAIGVGAVGLGHFEAGHLLQYLAVVLLSAMYALTFVVVGVAFSAWSTSSRRILLGSFVAYLVMTSYWAGLVELLANIVYRFQIETFPTWASVLQFMSPTQAYGYLLGQLYALPDGAYYSLTGAASMINQWTALIVLGGWIVLPTVWGYYQFSSANL